MKLDELNTLTKYFDEYIVYSTQMTLDVVNDDTMYDLLELTFLEVTDKTAWMRNDNYIQGYNTIRNAVLNMPSNGYNIAKIKVNVCNDVNVYPVVVDSVLYVELYLNRLNDNKYT